MAHMHAQVAHDAIFAVILDHPLPVDGLVRIEITAVQEAGVDFDDRAKGLPDDRCQSPHWGYVVKGKVTFRYPDREETYESGDAYYAPPGHIPVITAGTDIIEFSPTEEYGKTMEVLAGNLATTQSS